MLRTIPTGRSRGRTGTTGGNVVLASLLLGTFVTGSAELLTAGLLAPISSGSAYPSWPPARSSVRMRSDWRLAAHS